MALTRPYFTTNVLAGTIGPGTIVLTNGNRDPLAVVDIEQNNPTEMLRLVFTNGGQVAHPNDYIEVIASTYQERKQSVTLTADEANLVRTVLANWDGWTKGGDADTDDKLSEQRDNLLTRLGTPRRF